MCSLASLELVTTLVFGETEVLGTIFVGDGAFPYHIDSPQVPSQYDHNF